MVDTAFYTPPEKVARRADPYSFAMLTAIGADLNNMTEPPKLESGGGGLIGTLADYARFLAMLDRGGALDGRRLIGPRTLAFMTCDQLAPHVIVQHPLLPPGNRFGLGFGVRVQPGLAPTAGSVGEYFWGGVAGTAFFVSPRDELFAVLMLQAPEYRDYFRQLFRTLVYAAVA
jgi:CubicO group peptidase (beta-lactamase class C family)